MPKRSVLSAEQRALFRDLARAKAPEDLKTPYTRMTAVIPASAQEVKAARAKLKQSQRLFADWLGVSLQTVQAWEAGRRTPEAVATKVIRYGVTHPHWVHDFAAPTLLNARSTP